MNRKQIIIIGSLFVTTWGICILCLWSIFQLNSNYRIFTGHMELASKVPELVKRHNQLSAKILYQEGKIAQLENNTPKAINLYKEALSVNPNEPLIHLGLGKLAFLKGDFNNALKHALKEYKISPQNIDCNVLLGAIYYSQGNWAAAETHFKFIVQNEPLNWNAVNNLAETYREMGLALAASQTLKSYLNKKGDLYFQFKYFMALISLERKEEVLEILKPAIQKNQLKLMDNVLLSAIHFNDNEHSKAIEYYNQAKQLAETPNQLSLLFRDPIFKGLKLPKGGS